MDQSQWNLINPDSERAPVKPMWDRDENDDNEDAYDALKAFKVSKVAGIDHKYSRWNKNKINPFFIEDANVPIPENKDVIGIFFWLKKRKTRG